MKYHLVLHNVVQVVLRIRTWLAAPRFVSSASYKHNVGEPITSARCCAGGEGMAGRSSEGTPQAQSGSEGGTRVSRETHADVRLAPTTMVSVSFSQLSLLSWFLLLYEQEYIM